MPAFYVFAGIDTSLASRKLLLALARSDANDASQSVYRDLSAVMLAIATDAPNWTERLKMLATRYGDLWVVQRFLYMLIRMPYRFQALKPIDQSNIEQFFRMVLPHSFSFSTKAARDQWVEQQIQALQADRLRHSPGRLGEEDPSVTSIVSDDFEALD